VKLVAAKSIQNNSKNTYLFDQKNEGVDKELFVTTLFASLTHKKYRIIAKNNGTKKVKTTLIIKPVKPHSNSLTLQQ